MWERWAVHCTLRWIKPAYIALIGAMIAPTAIPLLPAETYIRFVEATLKNWRQHRRAHRHVTLHANAIGPHSCRFRQADISILLT
jgi:hypothetical protein